MKKDATLQIRIDADTKRKVEELYASLGTSFSEAVRIFARQSLLKGGLPFIMVPAPDKTESFGALAEYADPAKISRERKSYILALEEHGHGSH